MKKLSQEGEIKKGEKHSTFFLTPKIHLEFLVLQKESVFLHIFEKPRGEGKSKGKKRRPKRGTLFPPI